MILHPAALAFNNHSMSDSFYAAILPLGGAILSRLLFFSFLEATWWMAGYERYLFPVMPLASCFFLLLVYQAIAILRRRNGFSLSAP
jgi:hypothetical protein